jgi:hypothetical protein
VASRGSRKLAILLPAVPRFKRDEQIKALGVTFNRQLSASQHVDDELVAKCAQSLSALRALQHHGLPSDALYAVFQATVVTKLALVRLGMVSPPSLTANI